MRIERRTILAVTLAFTLGVTAARAQDILHTLSDPSQGFSDVADCVGDVDADGFTDFAITTGGPFGVRVFSGATGAVLHVFAEPQLIGFGNCLDGAGDVDADGHDDVIIGCGEGPGINPGIAIVPSQSVRVYSGQTGALLHSIDFIPWGLYGHAVAGLGDVDGDGKSDFAVGAPKETVNGLMKAGAVRVYSGATGTVLTTVAGTAAGEELGQALAKAGDYDADGAPDMVVAGNLGGGTVKVVSALTGAVLTTFQGPTWPAAPPPAVPANQVIVADAADFDADGVLDFAAARPGDPAGGPNAGSVYVFSGASGAVLIAKLGQPCFYLGMQLAAGDFTGDGYADLIVGIQNDLNQPDESYVYSGATGELVIDSLGYLADATTAACAGDVDGDGFEDVLIGNDPFGTAPGEVRVIGGGPHAGPAAVSAVNGGEDVLFVNGESGGAMRRVDVPSGGALAVTVAAPSTSTLPAHFVVFGSLGFPPEASSFSLGPVGDLAVPPSIAFPGYPGLFVLADTTGALGGIVPALPAPWSASSASGLPFPVEIALQGVIQETPTLLKTTNGVLLRVE